MSIRINLMITDESNSILDDYQKQYNLKQKDTAFSELTKDYEDMKNYLVSKNITLKQIRGEE